MIEAKQMMDELGFEVELPMKVYVDNVAAIHVANNNFARTTTRHVNVRYHHVRELIADGMVEVVFIRTKDNTSDILTKNCERVIFVRHEGSLVDDVPKELKVKERQTNEEE